MLTCVCDTSAGERKRQADPHGPLAKNTVGGSWGAKAKASTHTHATPTPTYIHLAKCEHTTPHTHTQKVDDDLDVNNAKLA